MASMKLPGKKPRRTLEDIFSGPDEFRLLDVKPKSKALGRIEEGRFEEINLFIDRNRREPNFEGDLTEKSLARRLASFRGSRELCEVLLPLDRHSLLHVDDMQGEAELLNIPQENAANIEIDHTASSLDDILNSSAFASLGSGDSSIFAMAHVKPLKERNTPDEIAQRKVCSDFYQFESLFQDTLKHMQNGTVDVIPFSREYQVEEGDMFIYSGSVVLVDQIGEYQEDEGGRYNPRLRLIYDNGTESNLLLRSLSRGLYKDPHGRRIVRDADSVIDKFNNVNHKDRRTGQVYFVTTLSDNPVLKSIPHLIKIGYTKRTVEERTRDAEKDATFLEAPVRILGAFDCHNLNPNKFETLVHGVLHAQRLQMKLIGKDGKTYQPKEWFSVDLQTAKEVVQRIIDGSIVNYRMNNTTGKLVSKR
ncbi:MAG: Uncharacterised protein [Gammaproteobacteria bacterium]|nr:MAG: Uncharacterised protein [Gammaproteobacteria bacterium]